MGDNFVSCISHEEGSKLPEHQMLKCGEHFDPTQFMHPVKKHLDLCGMLSQLFFLFTTYLIR